MIDHLRGELSSREEKQLEQYLDANAEALEKMKELERSWSLLDQYQTEPLSRGAESRILKSLQQAVAEEKHRSKFPLHFRSWAMAAGILFLLGFAYLTYNYFHDTTIDRHTISSEISWISDDHAGNRIEAIQEISTHFQLTPPMKSALFEVLNHDPDKNVRLMALETLLKFAGDPEIRKLLISSIENQDTPHLQLPLIQMAQVWELNYATPFLEKLLTNPETDPFIKQRIKQTLKAAG